VCALRSAAPTEKFGDKKYPLAAPDKSLKTLKTANEMFGKAWRFQAIDLEKLDKKLGKACNAKRAAYGLDVSRPRITLSMRGMTRVPKIAGPGMYKTH
jgi:hypothetical protein